MPLYEYECDKCGQRFEVIEKFSAQPLTTHQACGGEVHRLLSAPSLQFKGSGWYITDYPKGGSKASSDNGGDKKTDSPEPPSAASSDSGTSTTPKAPSSSTETKKSSSSDSKS